jgi:hypothetical protein
MASQFSSIRTKLRLEIALATDTILYLPFYLAYYNNDFSDTPSCDLEVVIIGGKNDLRFHQRKKLRGDGFATFSVLLGLADAAICDPSYLVYLNNCEDESIKSQLNLFQYHLVDDTKKDICKDFDPILTECLEMKGNELVFKDLSIFKVKILQKYTKVIGGLVSKIAFLAVGSADIKDDQCKDKNIGRLYLKDSKPSNFGSEKILNSFIHYESPSTGNCIGEIYYNKFKIENPHITTYNSKFSEFGKELQYLLKSKFQKESDDNWKEVINNELLEKSVAFSCDFISIDFLLDKHNYENGQNQKIVELEDLAYGSKNFLFTGIIGNTKPENAEKLKALLYGIDFNLYKINSYLKKSDTTGLIQYLKTKLKYDDEKQDIVLDLLIADEYIKEYIKYHINSKSIQYSFENVLKYYVDRLREWKQVGNLYYSKTTPVKQDLKELTELRYRSENKPSNNIQYENFIFPDLLSDFRAGEARYFHLEEKALYKRKIKWLIIFAPILLLKPFYQLIGRGIQRITNLEPVKDSPKLFQKIGKGIQRITGKSYKYILKLFLPIEAALWVFVRRPLFLYLMGSIFILLEVTSSMFHIFHFSGFDLDKLSYYHSTTKLVPGSLTEHYSVLYSTNFGVILFGMFFIYFISAFILFTEISLLKQDSKYFYRNE